MMNNSEAWSNCRKYRIMAKLIYDKKDYLVFKSMMEEEYPSEQEVIKSHDVEC